MYPPPQHIGMGCQPMLLPYNKEGRGHVGVSFTNCELSGPDQGLTSWRA